ncbi:SubName: Full=Uncharacterized protein {ECO:0000313/EMBL:CCA68951.1} [Serendipita indica DSM 11827]|uniref:Uncharacterized protein n=1 Tax=Serendipita indica (strain DSM 11827) TaxID=1109443 RepID=G4TCB5_SERID|nr:SubName: Full=Uncharacterized protein {ECO:0000313/EMBL:CCA68951.1} [Serendipita indica DSM 11827]CCA68951.1 hypothetical protein PIIN_02811 [Serendipita indica DSM 11827]
MASRRIPTLEQLQCMRRADLQKLAKDYNIKANLRTDALIGELIKVRTRQLARTTTPSNTNAIQFTRRDDEEERKPTPSSTSSSELSSPPAEITITARMRQQNHMTAPSKTSKIPIGAKPTARFAPKTVIPPGVVAANPTGVKPKGRVVGNSKHDSVPQGQPSKAKYRRAEEIKQDHEMEDATFATAQGDRVSVSSSSPQRSPGRQTSAHPESTSSWTLESRIKNLEASHDLQKSRQESEIATLRNLLSQAQDNISGLIRENNQLRRRLDSAPTVEDMTAIFHRLALLEGRFQSGAPAAASISSSDADAAMVRPRITFPKFETPPNLHARRETKTDVPVSQRIFDSTHRDRAQQLRTPPPQFGRYPLNPHETPSPTRPSRGHGTLVRYDPDDSASGSQSSLYRSLNPTHGAYSNSSSKRLRDSEPSKRGRSISSEEETSGHDDNRTISADSTPLNVKSEHLDQPLGFNLVPHLESRPVDPLPIAVESSPEPQSYSETEYPDVVASGSHSRAKRSAPRGNKSARRSHPYARPPDSYKSVGGADKDVPATLGASGTKTPTPQRPLDIRDMFGATPDLEYIPPTPLGDGIPVLDLGAPPDDARGSQSSTPIVTRSLLLPIDETPPAARTLYGTEFGTAMRAKFSDA